MCNSIRKRQLNSGDPTVTIPINELWQWHWLNTIGLVLALLGALYVGVDFLDKRYIFLKALTHGIAFGIVIAFFFGFVVILSYLIVSISHFVLSLFVALESLGTTSAYSVGVSDTLTNALIDRL